VLAKTSPSERFSRPLIGVLVVLLGGLVVVEPKLALAAAGVVVLFGLAVLPPVWLLTAVLFLTIIVPYGVQKTFGVPPGSGSTGLLLSDVLLLAALVRAVPAVLRMRLRGRIAFAAVILAGFLAICALQFLHGVAAGRKLSTVGYEFRVLLGFAAFYAAIPVFADERERARFLRVLPVLGLVLGLWGLIQWVFNVTITQSADSGVTAGVRLTTSGRGQLQGGLFAFPAAILLALGALMSGQVRSRRARALLLAVIGLNVVCLVFTYERTFWIATTVGALFVVAKFGGTQRLRALAWGSVTLLAAFGLLATLAPNDLAAARERLLSLSQYSSDYSVRYRTTESRHVATEIRARPITGSGFGASIFWGRPWDQVPPFSQTFAHNGYLWIAWKLGIPAAVLLFLVYFLAVAPFRRRGGDTLFDGVQIGARGALLTLAIASVTLPAFNQLSITAALGVLMAMSLTTVRQRDRQRGVDAVASYSE
jgi:hypothetical protein